MIPVSAERPGAGFREERGSHPASINTTLVFRVKLDVRMCLSMCYSAMFPILNFNSSEWIIVLLAALNFLACATIQAITRATCFSRYLYLPVGVNYSFSVHCYPWTREEWLRKTHPPMLWLCSTWLCSPRTQNFFTIHHNNDYILRILIMTTSRRCCLLDWPLLWE